MNQAIVPKKYKNWVDEATCFSWKLNEKKNMEEST